LRSTAAVGIPARELEPDFRGPPRLLGNIMAFVSSRRLWSVTAGLLVAGVGLSAAQQPSPQPPVASPPAADPTKVVAYIYGTVPVTQEAFGKYLMDRGGADKLELFVNKLIIETEARKRNVTVTDLEMKAALDEDIAGVSAGGAAVSRQDFVKIVLAKHDKTFYEWMEDIVRPRLLLQKMCYDRVKAKVTEAELKKQFDRRYGEQRLVQIIMYPLGDPLKVIQEQYAKYRNDPVEFDSAARAQANPGLAASKGLIKPVTRHLIAEDKIVEDTAFKLKKGEVSEVIQTRQGYIVMKMVEAIPANAKADFAKERPVMEKAAFDELLLAEIPAFFAELKKAANVTTTYQPPAEWRTIGATSTVPSVIPAGPAGVRATAPQQPGGK